MRDEVVIVAAARTPIGAFMGSLAQLPATELGGIALRAVLDSAGVEPGAVDEVVMGHVLTAERLIRRALLIEEGDQLRTGDPRFRRSRFRVLALGYFVDVQLRLDRGSQRGSVVVTVEVWERGAVVLDSIFLGSDDALSPFWVGLDAAVGFTPPSWLGSSVAAIAVSGLLMVVLGRLTRRTGARSTV